MAFPVGYISRAGDNLSAWDGTEGWGTGTESALFLKKFSGEVLTTFNEKNVMMPLHRVRTITNGKSASFPVTGIAKAAYMVAGKNILTDSNNDTVAAGGTPTNTQLSNEIVHTEKIISVDNILVASTMIYDLDSAMNHYDQRAIYSEELGKTLAKVFDQHTMFTALAAARGSANITGVTAAGTQVTDADFATNGASAVDTIFSIAQQMDEQDIPAEDRYCIVKPQTFYNLAKQTDLVNKDFGGEGNGSFPSAMVRECAGIKIVMSNHLPSTNLSADTQLEVANDVFGGSGSGYLGNFSTTVGLAFHKSAIGTVKLMDLSVQSDYKVEYQGTLMVARYAMGHGVLRPESAFEVITA